MPNPSSLTLSRSWRFLRAAACLLFPVVATAQVARPDAGQVLQGNADKKLLPPPPLNPDLLPKAAGEKKPPVSGGVQVLVSDVRFTGNTVYTQERLKAIVAESLGQKHDLAGMKQIAEKVTDFYREKGYPFARALVPAQEFDDGVLKIQVLEGRYSSIKAVGEDYVARGSTPFLASLRVGDLIYGPRLESAMLILDDVPGVAVSPSVSPGAKVETADLAVAVSLETKRGGDVGVDNHGSRFTGRYRARGQYYENSALFFGDKATFDFVTTNHQMLLGSFGYEGPLAGNGLRGEIGFSLTRYILSEDYEALGISGLARVWSAKLNYPLLRSQAMSFTLSMGYQHKVLHDNFSVLNSVEDKSSDLMVSSVRFDMRDGLFGGGLTYGMLTSTYGRLNLYGNLIPADAATADKVGLFNKVALDIARIQSVGAGLIFYARGSFQWSDKNLDSSEKLGGGGADAVRSYPLGEATGDVGWLGQAELRYQIGNNTPYLFYDYCDVSSNYRPWDINSAQNRRLAGFGAGVRSAYGQWSSELTMAHRTLGGVSRSDASFGQTILWFSLARSF